MITYEKYVAAYEALLKLFLSYTPNEVGSGVYASKLSDLEEAHAAHAETYNEQF